MVARVKRKLLKGDHEKSLCNSGEAQTAQQQLHLALVAGWPPGIGHDSGTGDYSRELAERLAW